MYAYFIKYLVNARQLCFVFNCVGVWHIKRTEQCLTQSCKCLRVHLVCLHLTTNTNIFKYMFICVVYNLEQNKLRQIQRSATYELKYQLWEHSFITSSIQLIPSRPSINYKVYNVNGFSIVILSIQFSRCLHIDQ